MNAPVELRYTKDHEWIKVEGNIATVGITDYAQHALGDIVFVELPQTGSKCAKDKQSGVVESVKSVSDVFAPVSGTVSEVNSDLENDPEQVNKSPYDKGWMFKIEMSDNSELDDMLDSKSYSELTETE